MGYSQRQGQPELDQNAVANDALARALNLFTIQIKLLTEVLAEVHDGQMRIEERINQIELVVRTTSDPC